MTPARTFKLLAIANLSLGALLTLSTLATIFGAMKGPADLIAWLLGAFLAAVAFSLLQAGWSHLRAASAKTALVLAANTAVVVFGVVVSVLRRLEIDQAAEPLFAIGAILVACGVYRWLLRPLAIRGFASEEKKPNKALEPTTMAVTSRAPSSTSRASHGRGSS